MHIHYKGHGGVRYASGGTHKLKHSTNRHTILQIWMYFIPIERSVQDWKAEFFITIVQQEPQRLPLQSLGFPFYPSGPLTGDCLHLYNHFVVSHFGELVCEQARWSFCQEHKCKCLHGVFDFRPVSLAHAAPAAGDSCDMRRALWSPLYFFPDTVGLFFLTF